MIRIYHTWDKWECYPAGFYEPRPPKALGKVDADHCKRLYAEFLANSDRFRAASRRVISEWKFSCEHYLTNERMNRIAWMGQAAMCIETGVSKFFCGGYFLLSKEQQHAADMVALDVINEWMAQNGYDALTPETATSKTQADLY